MSDDDNFHVRIKPHFSVIAHSGNAVELRSGVWNPTSCMLTDENNDDKLLKIIKALDGTRSLKEISKNLSISRTEIESVIDHLQQMGAIETTPSSVFDLYLQQASPSLHTSNIIESNVTPKWPILLMGDNTLVQSVSTLLQQFMSKNFFDVLTHTDERFQLLNDLDEDFMHHGLEF
jgi:biotin operon repressor